MKSRATALILTCLTLASCSFLKSNDPSKLAFNIPDGSSLQQNQSITVDHNNTHATIQYGAVIDDGDRHFYDVNCRLDLREFGPRKITPETYTITRVEDSSNWISQPVTMRYYTEVYLSSQKGTDVIKLVCQQYGSQTDKNFTVAEMQEAFGDIFTIIYPSDAIIESPKSEDKNK